MSVDQDIESVTTAALRLRPAARAALTQTLVRSLEGLSDAEREELWITEAERREAEFELGAVQPVDGRDMMQRLLARHGR